MSVSFGRTILPTKIELIRMKRNLQVSKAVHKILEDKRDVLLRRLDEAIIEATKARKDLDQPLSDAYEVLSDAYLAMGPIKLEAIAAAIPHQTDLKVDIRKVVGVDVPALASVEKTNLSYGFADTGYSLDKATQTIRALIPVICKAAEAENAIFRLANELEKTQRLINSLESIIIPKYEESIEFVSSTLEERAREEFVKLKHVKALLELKKR